MFKKNCDLMEDLGSKKGRYYFQNYYSRKSKPWFNKFQTLKRDLIVTIIRSRTGHYSLNDSLFKINVVESPDCHCGPFKQDLDIYFGIVECMKMKELSCIINLENVI